MRIKLPHLKEILPKSLFGRALLIMVIPAILVQLVGIYIFYERHWSSVVRNMSASLAGEIVLITQQSHKTNEAEKQRWQILAKNILNLKVQYSKENFTPDAYPEDSDFKELYDHLERRLGLPFSISHSDVNNILVRIKTADKNLFITIPSKKLLSPTTILFNIMTISSASILLLVSLIFLRNQIRPITRLARAAEGFGMGIDDPNFHPSGASEVRRAAKAFLTMRERISRQISARTDMLSGISHDLRTPLTRMKLSLAMIESEERENMLQDIEEMERMINEYLDFARGVEGESPENINICKYIANIITNHKNTDFTCGNNNIHLMLKRFSFKRALDNIIINALRYGGNICHISLKNMDNYIFIYIEDEGEAIDKKYFDEMFKPFKRLESSRNMKTGGVGLGMTIARDIVQAHGGDIMLENIKKDGIILGLRVIIRLPLQVK